MDYRGPGTGETRSYNPIDGRPGCRAKKARKSPHIFYEHNQHLAKYASEPNIKLDSPGSQVCCEAAVQRLVALESSHERKWHQLTYTA